MNSKGGHHGRPFALHALRDGMFRQGNGSSHLMHKSFNLPQKVQDAPISLFVAGFPPPCCSLQ
ncbi:hypothetical protein ACFQFS_15415 [Novosphingobium lubricantis]|jgi:hypothetical protein